MASVINDQKLKGMQPEGAPLTESLPGRGMGAILFKRPGEAPPSAYFRYRRDGKSYLVKIGSCKTGARGAGLTLPQIRERAWELAKVAYEHGDVKAHLAFLEKQAEAERHASELALAEQVRLRAIEAARGSLSELFNDYIDSRRGTVRESQVAELERVLRVELEEANPDVAEMKARDVRPGHIRQILLPIWDRGSKGMADKVRAYLHAAYQYGLTAEHSLSRTSRKSFALELNPVALLPKEHKATAQTRVLSDAELKHFWQTITQTDEVGPVMARLLKFVIATGGQRIDQVSREPWTSYDSEKRTLRLIDAKGRGGVRRVHLIPLSNRAIELLEEVEPLTGRHDFIWTTTGKKPIATTSPSHAVRDWLASKHGKINDEQIPHFTPRDLRRTCAQLMQRYGVENQISDLLQSHGQTGVVGQHYRNNPEAYLPEKLKAMAGFEAALSKVLG
jgi:integrase